MRTVRSAEASRAFDRTTEGRVRAYADQGDTAIANRIRQLELKWGIERVLEVNAASLARIGVVLG